ncbi:Agamous-like MADS-box protein AGL8-like [Vitis vinifera]|uniref:Agamous-like MADS-box protein AGL8-like n=1 Tax=Vitis vinifera TaxID=29760 RepID=A0A438JYL0_VITVI|nr:Agamous-like MADS-box protein AGL8-like [Vitis vinifera]
MYMTTNIPEKIISIEKIKELSPSQLIAACCKLQLQLSKGNAGYQRGDLGWLANASFTSKLHVVLQDFDCDSEYLSVDSLLSFGNSMERILERYERYAYAQSQLIATDLESQGSWTLEYAKLKARMEVLQKSQRNFMGEDLDSLSLKELQNLEQQLDNSLKSTRIRKNQLMYESLSELHKKGKALQEEHDLLTAKVQEKEKEQAEQAQWNQQNQDLDSPSFLLQQPLHALNISGNCLARDSGDDQGIPPQNRTNTPLPAWMLRHVNK